MAKMTTSVCHVRGLYSFSSAGWIITHLFFPFLVFCQTHHITLAFQWGGARSEEQEVVGGVDGYGRECGWRGVAGVSVALFPSGAQICGSSGEGRAGAWEFTSCCICMLHRLPQQTMAWGKNKALEENQAEDMKANLSLFWPPTPPT